MDLNMLLKENGLVFFDGGMGTELASRGLEMSGVINLESPEAVLSVHRDYRQAGARVLTTNTFSMNRLSIEAHKYSVDLHRVNLAGVSLAREAGSENCLVFGDIGPTGRLLEPYGNYKEKQFYQCFAEQASILEEAGVDGLIAETFTDLREAACVMRACREKTDLPVILSLAFSRTDQGGRTVMGATVAGAVEVAEEFGASAVGANCGDLDPAGMAVIAGLFRECTDLPVIIQPNAGIPRLEGGKTVFDMQPGEYAAGVARCIEAGASIVGGCCGTTPAHIEALVGLAGKGLK